MVVFHPWAHINGVPTPANIQAPAEVGIVADEEAQLTWLDNDADPTGKFNFFFQAENVPTSTLIGDGSLHGELIAGAQGIMVSDPADAFTWDTRLVPAGSYFVYAITDDPPIAPVYGMSRGVITVRHPGDPLFPAVQVTAPGAVAPPVDQEGYALRWQASGEGPFTASLEFAPLGTGAHPIDPVWQPLADGVPMEGAEGCLVWDTDALDDGYYGIHVTVSDGAGRTHAAYAANNVTVYHDGTSGPAASCAAVLPDAGPDAGGSSDAGTSPEQPDGCGCRVGQAAPPFRLLALGVAAMIVLLGRRRRG